MEKNLKGKVKWFDNVTKGYGFINLIGTEADYFFHMKHAIDQDLIKDEIVLFDEIEGKKGLCAGNVRRLTHFEAVTNGKR